MLEDLYFLSFIDMTTIQPEVYHELLSIYRDIALLKALYWRLFPLFRWLLQHTVNLLQSPLFSVLKTLQQVTSDDELAAVLDSPNQQNTNLVANMTSLEQHLAAFMPCMVGKFKPGDMGHLDSHKKKSITR